MEGKYQTGDAKGLFCYLVLVTFFLSWNVLLKGGSAPPPSTTMCQLLKNLPYVTRVRLQGISVVKRWWMVIWIVWIVVWTMVSNTTQNHYNFVVLQLLVLFISKIALVFVYQNSNPTQMHPWLGRNGTPHSINHVIYKFWGF